jgi:hypothetical protein
MTTKPQKNYRAPPEGQLPREYKTETDKRNYHYQNPINIILIQVDNAFSRGKKKTLMQKLEPKIRTSTLTSSIQWIETQ